MIRIHDGKLTHGKYAKEGTKKVTVDAHVYSTVFKSIIKKSYANVTCPVCGFVNKIDVGNEDVIEFKCNCGQKLQFKVPKGDSNG